MSDEAVDTPKTVRVGEKDLPVWYEEQRVEVVDEHLYATVFDDWPDYHDPLIARVHELEEIKWGDDKPDSRTLGGKKVHHLEQWDCPAADLINERAKEFFRRLLNEDTANIDQSWANLYYKWDYAIPHSHRLSVASLVYFLEIGDPDPDDELSGRLSFADPRMKICCSDEEGYVTTRPYIGSNNGKMLIWPSKFVHFVTPYAGDNPRITLAWNISRYKGELLPDDKPIVNVAPTPTSRV